MINRISNLSCNLFMNCFLYLLICYYCKEYYSILNTLILLLMCIDALNLQNMEQFSTSLSRKQASQQKKQQSPDLKRRRSFSSIVSSAFVEISLQDDTSYSNWLNLYPSLLSRSVLYWIFCLQFLVKHFFLLFSKHDLDDSSSLCHHLIYALNGGYSNSLTMYYEFILYFFIAFLSHVLILFYLIIFRILLIL